MKGGRVALCAGAALIVPSWFEVVKELEPS